MSLGQIILEVLLHCLFVNLMKIISHSEIIKPEWPYEEILSQAISTKVSVVSKGKLECFPKVLLSTFN